MSCGQHDGKMFSTMRKKWEENMFETMFWDSQLADDNTSETTVALGRVGLDGMDLWVG